MSKSLNRIMTIDDLINNGHQVWVVNRTERLPQQKKKASPLFVSMDVNDKGVVCVIPTGAPILLSDQIPNDSLLKSNDLRRLISEGTLDLLDTDAINKLASDAVQKSRSTVAKWRSDNRDPMHGVRKTRTKKSTESVSNTDTGIAKGLTKEEIAEMAREGAGLDDYEGQPSPQVITALNSLRAELLTVDDVLEQLDAVSLSLTRVDLDYIKSETDNSEILSWVVEQLQRKED